MKSDTLARESMITSSETGTHCSRENVTHPGSLRVAENTIPWTKSKVLLWDTGNSVQHPVISHSGKEYEQECIHTYNWITLYTAETDTTFKSTICVHVLSYFSHVWLFVTPQTVAHQAPLSMEFSKQEYWSGFPCPPPGDLPDPGIEPESLTSPALASGFFTPSAIREAPNQLTVNKKKLPPTYGKRTH